MLYIPECKQQQKIENIDHGFDFSIHRQDMNIIFFFTIQCLFSISLLLYYRLTRGVNGL
jgi:hypothetical protein